MQILRVLVAISVFLGAAFGGNLSLVVPNAQATTPGNDNSGSLSLSDADLQYQQVFGRGQFSSVPGYLLITDFAFRASPGTGTIDVTDTSFSVYMSTSPYAPNSNNGNTLITSTFASNVGPDNTLVLSGGPGTLWSSPGCAGPGPCPFDMAFTLSTPFLYNPSQGFLLLEFQATGLNGVSGANGAFDVESFSSPGGSVASVFSLTTGSTTGTVQLSGNVVQFGYTLVPEPASCALLLGGLGALAAMRRKLSSRIRF
ncbi:MAG TPA: VPLPA-CTERM sorting domain-containing protein [Bryobacteraceae bacterium]|nr:VPLPA-CTERM sorting domain-containing protein [Bryobacteraceae bacterium]